MTAQKLMDAMNYLPEELLERTDALRQKKRLRWKPVAAVAACLCLVAGLWLLNPGLKAANGAASSDEAYFDEDAGMGAINQESGSTAGIVVRVYEVHEDYILVQYVYANGFCDGIPIQVSLEELEQIPQFSVGQKICIYTNQQDITHEIIPYKIVIMQEE